MNVTRLPVRLAADPRRVIARSFVPGEAPRIRAVIDRVRALPDAVVSSMVAALVTDYRQRHKDIRGIFRQNYATAIALARENLETSDERRLLLGAYFTLEYSLESVALFNPSMVLHPDQNGVPRGSVRFIMTLRACGEGHISSIEFRTGTLDARQGVAIDPPTRFALTARPGQDDAVYEKESYLRKLVEMQAHTPSAVPVLALLDSYFTMSDLKYAIERCRTEANITHFEELADNMLWLAHSNYELEFSPDAALSERVIFPVSESESRGIEDARFVRFVYPDGRVTYYATYTAYNGFLRVAAAHRDYRLSPLQDEHAERQVRAEQGHGALPPQGGRPLRDGFEARRREHLPAEVRQHPLLERVDARSCAEVPLGNRAGRQLRVADRDRRRLDPPGRTASGRCGSTGSARSCSISKIRRASSAS